MTANDMAVIYSSAILPSWGVSSLEGSIISIPSLCSSIHPSIHSLNKCLSAYPGLSNFIFLSKFYSLKNLRVANGSSNCRYLDGVQPKVYLITLP